MTADEWNAAHPVGTPVRFWLVKGIAGGVAANSRIRGEFTRETQRLGVRLCMPPLSLCGDNGAMIGAQGYYEYLAGKRAGQDLNAYATMSLENG